MSSACFISGFHIIFVSSCEFWLLPLNSDIQTFLKDNTSPGSISISVDSPHRQKLNLIPFGFSESSPRSMVRFFFSPPVQSQIVIAVSVDETIPIQSIVRTSVFFAISFICFLIDPVSWASLISASNPNVIL